ncbi:hypothetical protein [Maribacter sp. HTCC2170]|uniref:hypothetical protein n=1 Tax=Maribacter sp. (strain HTCC2170 / KCCM 42371) TaxID=313603 RepID=UPI00006BD35C|nr:hypothetical protein [Maribacter sp. HTCC2170]EAR02569.1 hypothetical protein FB2170_04760 [Maribacter sp. HTCC2170]
MSEYIEHRIKGNAERFFKGFFKVLIGGIIVIGLILLFGYITMRLWNWLMPEVFGLTTLGYWQALGILVLAKIFFGGFGDHSSKKRDKKFKNKCKSKDKTSSKKDFSNWKYYDQFWQEEGEKAFNNYVNQRKESNTE